MSSDDRIFVTQSFVSYITNKNMKLKYKVYPNRTHGMFIADAEMQHDVLQTLDN